MDNPFVYGEVVPGEAFVDREPELDRLIADLGSGQKVFLISPRRYGKSSLIRQALDALRRRGALAVELTVSSYSSYLAFLEGYARAIASVESKWDRARTWLTEAIASTRPEIRYEPKDTGLGRLSVAFPQVSTARDVNRLANEVFALPGRLAAERKRTVVIALDEFQAIDSFNGGSVEHAPARRRAASAAGRLCVCRLGTEPHGEDDRTAPSVLQGRAGDASAEDCACALYRLHRQAFHQERYQAGARCRRRHHRPCGQPSLRRAATGARNVGRCAGKGWEKGDARRLAPGARATIV
jgi:hypothetical protein